MTKQPSSSSRVFMPSDIGYLRKVLVHSVQSREQIINSLGDELLPYAEVDMEALSQQQANFINLLRKNNVEVIELSDALDAAIIDTRPSGELLAWIRAAYPRLISRIEGIKASTILGRDPDLQFPIGDDGNYRHIVDYTNSMMWIRDAAFMAPQGLVLCNSLSMRRRHESTLLRFIYTYSPMLREYPIILDAAEEGLIIDGGDAQIIDEHTLLLGVGNRTDIRAAPILAKRLNMDVLTVQITDREFIKPRATGENDPIRELLRLFLHLDTFFTQLGANHVLTIPYLLEEKYADLNPFVSYFRGACADTLMTEISAKAAIRMLKGFGNVRFFLRDTGIEKKIIEKKLVDYLRESGYRITFVGGSIPEKQVNRFQHFMTVTYQELRRQAANTAQIIPRRTISFSGAPFTKAALEADGIEVDVVGGRELWAWHGGPHCLIQPLQREKPV